MLKFPHSAMLEERGTVKGSPFQALDSLVQEGNPLLLVIQQESARGKQVGDRGIRAFHGSMVFCLYELICCELNGIC